MFECLAIDDNLVLKPKDNCWIDFWLENQHLPLWRQRQLVKSCGKKIWNFEFQQNLAREIYQNSKLDCWLSTNSKNLRVFASIKTLEAKFVFMKISWRPLPRYGCFLSQYHEKISRNIFLPKCLENDDTLVLKPKKPAGYLLVEKAPVDFVASRANCQCCREKTTKLEFQQNLAR